MKIVEKIRARARDKDAEISELRSRIRRLTQTRSEQFELGWQAAITHVEAGATAEQLRASSGVVAAEWEDTRPMPVGEFEFEEDTYVEIHARPPEEVYAEEP